MTSLLRIDNQRARRIFLDRHALLEPRAKPLDQSGLRDLIERIGFVQIDSIATVERAHHMILFARNVKYRPAHLTPLIETERQLWEHWTHDASILPVEVYPHWHHRFAHNRATLVKRWTGWQEAGFEKEFDRVLRHISDHGPVSASDLQEGGGKRKGGWWEWHPSKTALEYLWHSGDLAISRRENFRKLYDLAERVIPAAHRDSRLDRDETIDWACRSALKRIGFGSAKEIAAYWQAISLAEAQHWCKQALGSGEIVPVEVEGGVGTKPRLAYAFPNILAASRPEPVSGIRILSPFDPALRDRDRAEFLFGFHYRIEIYTPAPKRKYGYYVFPVLEGDRILGRIDTKAHRDEGCLRVRAFWPEAGVTMGKRRIAALEKELHRLARFAGCDRIDFAQDWMRDSLGA